MTTDFGGNPNPIVFAVDGNGTQYEKELFLREHHMEQRRAVIRDKTDYDDLRNL